MGRRRAARPICFAAAWLFLGGRFSLALAGQAQAPAASQLPPGLRGAKVYHLADQGASGNALENPALYKSLSYEDINWDRLLLNLFVSLKPVDRPATVRKMYFQNIRVGDVPVHIDTFEQEFKVSNKEAIDLPAPLKCSVVFSDLDSLSVLKTLLSREKVRVTGESFIEVKLNALEKVVLRTRQLVLPVKLNEEVPMQLFAGSPLIAMVAKKIVDTLSDPSTTAAIGVGKERFARLAAERALAPVARSSVYLLYCEYVLRNPLTGAAEQFSQSGTGFVVSADGKMLTAKRVVQPWKFDPQVAFLTARYHLEFDPKSYRILAWPAGSRVLTPDGRLDFETALSTEKQMPNLLKTVPDRMEKRDYRDPDSGESATVELHAPGAGDAAVLQLAGNNFQPVALQDFSRQLGPDAPTALIGFPYGLSQPQADPRLSFVKTAAEKSLITLDRALNPGESGAPLVTAEGKVVAIAAGTNECIPIEGVRNLLQ